jgi:hypothetical protein
MHQGPAQHGSMLRRRSLRNRKNAKALGAKQQLKHCAAQKQDGWLPVIMYHAPVALEPRKPPTQELKGQKAKGQGQKGSL